MYSISKVSVFMKVKRLRSFWYLVGMVFAGNGICNLYCMDGGIYVWDYGRLDLSWFAVMLVMFGVRVLFEVFSCTVVCGGSVGIKYLCTRLVCLRGCVREVAGRVWCGL
jgi:hypothetical protein